MRIIPNDNTIIVKSVESFVIICTKPLILEEEEEDDDNEDDGEVIPSWNLKLSEVRFIIIILQ